MRANDLMLGNFIYHEEVGAALIVSSDVLCEIEEMNMKFFEGEFPLPYKRLPLTEDWLERFGFKMLDKYTFVKGGVFIYNRKRGFVYGSRSRNLTIEYVHDLQNLFKALTKKDLKINV